MHVDKIASPIRLYRKQQLRLHTWGSIALGTLKAAALAPPQPHARFVGRRRQPPGRLPG
jgi:hypothetical protein